MTRREWVEKNAPENVSNVYTGGVCGCPGDDEYAAMPGYDPNIDADTCSGGTEMKCTQCWDRPCFSEEPSTVDNVNHPAHYELPGGIECFDVLLATQGLEAVKSFCICNAVKYLFRRNRKNGDEDVKKAAWYIAKYIELAKEANANG